MPLNKFGKSSLHKLMSLHKMTFLKFDSIILVSVSRDSVVLSGEKPSSDNGVMM